MKVLVTGATGFIGNYVILELLRHKVDVIATSRSIEKAKSFEWFDKVDFKEFNINNLDVEENLVHYFSNPDAIIHLAWEGLPNYDGDIHTNINLPNHYNFIENFILNGLNDINVIGTCFEYGLKNGCLSESIICNPVTKYGKAKNELRIKLQQLRTKINFNLKWIRLFYLFGKGQNEKSLVPQLEAVIKNYNAVFNMSGGEQTRDFLPIELVAEYIVLISMQKRNIDIVNCCSGQPVTVKQFVENYLKNKGKELKLNLGHYPYSVFEPMHFWGNNNKLNTILHDHIVK